MPREAIKRMSVITCSHLAPADKLIDTLTHSQVLAFLNYVQSILFAIGGPQSSSIHVKDNLIKQAAPDYKCQFFVFIKFASISKKHFHGVIMRY